MACTSDAYSVAGITFPSQGNPAVAALLDLYYSPSCQLGWGEYDARQSPDVGDLTLSVQPAYGGVAIDADHIAIDGSGRDGVTTMTVSWKNSINVCVDPGGHCVGWR